MFTLPLRAWMAQWVTPSFRVIMDTLLDLPHPAWATLTCATSGGHTYIGTTFRTLKDEAHAASLSSNRDRHFYKRLGEEGYSLFSRFEPSRISTLRNSGTSFLS